MSYRNSIQRYDHSADSLKQDTFAPFILDEDEQAIQTGIKSLNSVADRLNILKKDIKTFFNKKPVSDQELLRLYHLSDEELTAELKRGYIIANEIKIQGLDVKLDKLTEIINIPDFTHILENFTKVKASIKFLDSILSYGITIHSFFTEEGIKLPEEKIDSIRYAYQKQTKSFQENKAYLAARKILEGFAELEDINVKKTQSEGFHLWASRLLRAIIQDKGGVVDVNANIFTLLKGF